MELLPKIVVYGAPYDKTFVNEDGIILLIYQFHVSSLRKEKRVCEKKNHFHSLLYLKKRNTGLDVVIF